MLAKLWLDEGGAILSAELLLLMVVIVIGVSVGIVAVRDAVDAQLVELGLAVAAINPSFGYDGLNYNGASAGSDSSASVPSSQYTATLNMAGVTVADVLVAIPPSGSKGGLGP